MLGFNALAENALAEIPGPVGPVTHSTSGVLEGQGASVAGTAAHIAVHATSGALNGQGASLAGAAARTREHATSGVLQGQGASVAGTATRFRAHATSGVLTGQGASLAGVSARFRAFSASGVLNGQGSSVDGSASRTRVHAADGVLNGQGASIAGNTTRFRAFSASGVLSGQGAEVSGTAARASNSPVVHDTSGVLEGSGAEIIAFASGSAVTPSVSGGGFLYSVWKKSKEDVYRERVRLGILPKPAKTIKRVLQKVAEGKVAPDHAVTLAKRELERLNIEWQQANSLLMEKMLLQIQQNSINEFNRIIKQRALEEARAKMLQEETDMAFVIMMMAA